MRKHLVLHNVIRTVVTIGIAMFSCLPYFWLAFGSFLPDAITDRGFSLDCWRNLTFDNHISFFKTEQYTSFLNYFENTIIVSTTTALVVICLSISLAYTLTRYQLSISKLLQRSILFGYFFPPIVLIFPYATLLNSMNISGSLTGLLLANIAFCFPFGSWLMIRYFNAIPDQFDKTAAADGASWWQTLWFVILPRALPGIAAVGIFSFILSWNDVVLSLILATVENRTLAAGVKESILDLEQTQNSSFAAASLWVATPAIIFFSVMEYWIDKKLKNETEDLYR